MSEYFARKLADFTDALAALQEALQIEQPSQLEKDGTIQRFEFCFELAWKTLKLALEEQGEMDVKTPKAAFSRGYLLGWISDESAYLDILRYRNLTSHTYDEELAEELYEHLPAFYRIFAQLRERFTPMG